MDIKAQVEKVVDKVKNDPAIASEFQKNPTSAVEKVIGVDLPDDAVNAVVDGVKAKLAGSKIGDAFSKIGGLFG